MAVITGHQGKFSMTSGAPWEELMDTTTSVTVGHIFRFDLEVEQEEIECTQFDATLIDGREYFFGMATAKGSFEGAYGADQAFPFGDLVPGTAQSTLLLTTETGKTITVTANLENIVLGVNRRTGLNSINADFVGQITAAA